MPFSQKIDTLMSEQRGLVHRQETIQATQEALRENLSGKRARAQVIDVQVADAQKRLDSAQTQAAELQHVFEELSKQHEHLQEQETSARNSLNTPCCKRDQGRSNLDAAREAIYSCLPNVPHLKSWRGASESANPLLAHVLDSRANLAPDSKVLSHVIKGAIKNSTDS